MSGSVKMNWYGDKAKSVVLKSSMNRIEAAAIHFQNAVKQNISVPSRSRVGSRLGKAIAARKKKP